MTGLQIAALVIVAIVAFVLAIADLDVLAAVSSAILWLIFSASVTLRSMAAVASRPEIHPLDLSDDELPNYTVVVALYREASVVEELVKAIDVFDYPKGKLDIKLVVEQRDAETLGRIVELRLPARYEVVVAPSGKLRQSRVRSISRCPAREGISSSSTTPKTPQPPTSCALRRHVSPRKKI
jgi:cellulose synthase/poly-beta-1,6-N-acetylglucosamine synthase-like glycosyltransferase